MPTQYIVLLFFLPLCFQRRMRIEEEYSKHARATISKLKVSLLNAQQLFFMTVILMEGKFILLIIKYVEFERLHWHLIYFSSWDLLEPSLEPIPYLVKNLSNATLLTFTYLHGNQIHKKHLQIRSYITVRVTWWWMMKWHQNPIYKSSLCGQF